MKKRYVDLIHKTLKEVGVIGLSRIDVSALIAEVRGGHAREKNTKEALKALRIANRNIGKDWPVVSLSIALAIETLGANARAKR